MKKVTEDFFLKVLLTVLHELTPPRSVHLCVVKAIDKQHEDIHLQVLSSCSKQVVRASV